MPKVREAIQLIEQDWWRLVRTRGSHRQFKHPVKRGRVTIPGKPGDDLPPGTWGQHIEAIWPEGVSGAMKYTVVIEKTPNNYAAYVPDLPGCVATASTREELLEEIRGAIEFHIEGMREDGEPVPEPQATADLVEVSAVAGA